MNITSERLAHWFFRLNGFLATSNFVVHVDQGFGQRTDVDVLGVRFPHRAENQIRPMADHPEFADATRVQVVLVETKRTRCRLNEAWTDAKRGNLERVLCAGGFVPLPEVPSVASRLYGEGQWVGTSLRVSLVAVGGEHNSGLERAYPSVRQLLWHRDVLPFIHERFWSYRDEKRMHPQWDADAHQLFVAALQTGGDLNAFLAEVVIDGS